MRHCRIFARERGIGLIDRERPDFNTDSRINFWYRCDAEDQGTEIEACPTDENGHFPIFMCFQDDAPRVFCPFCSRAGCGGVAIAEQAMRRACKVGRPRCRRQNRNIGVDLARIGIDHHTIGLFGETDC